MFLIFGLSSKAESLRVYTRFQVGRKIKVGGGVPGGGEALSAFVMKSSDSGQISTHLYI